MRTVAELLANLVQARLNCIDSGNAEWRDKHEARIQELVKHYLPSGGGFDSGTTVDLDKSTGNKLVFGTYFHHMNNVGMYTHWTHHVVTVTPSFIHGLYITIGGRDKNGIKDFIHDAFNNGLSLEKPNAGETGSE